MCWESLLSPSTSSRNQLPHAVAVVTARTAAAHAARSRGRLFSPPSSVASMSKAAINLVAARTEWSRRLKRRLIVHIQHVLSRADSSVSGRLMAYSRHFQHQAQRLLSSFYYMRARSSCCHSDWGFDSERRRHVGGMANAMVFCSHVRSPVRLMSEHSETDTYQITSAELKEKSEFLVIGCASVSDQDAARHALPRAPSARQVAGRGTRAPLRAPLDGVRWAAGGVGAFNLPLPCCLWHAPCRRRAHQLAADPGKCETANLDLK